MITSDNLANAFGIAFLVGAGGLGLLLLRTAFDDMEHEWRHGERVVAVANAFGIAFLVGAGGLGLLLLRTAFDDMEHEWRHGERVVAVAKALALLVCLSVVGILSVAIFWVGTGRLS